MIHPRAARFPLIAAAAALIPLLLAGCSGGAARDVPDPVPATGGSSTRTATIVFRIAWPAAGRLVPARAQAVQIIVTDGSTFTQTAILTPSAPETAFTNAPVGGLTATATAYPEIVTGANGQPESVRGTPQATRTVAFTTVSGVNPPVIIEMGSTVDAIQVDGLFAALPGQNASLTASARDADGNTVITDPAQMRWTSEDPSVATVPAAGTFDVNQNVIRNTVTGVTLGKTVITATDTESGISRSFTFSVTNNLGGVAIALANVPSAAARVRVAVALGGTTVATQVFDPSGPVVISNLPPSVPGAPYTVTATAFPQSDASGVAQARSLPTTLDVGANASISLPLPLVSTIQQITVAPTAATVYLAQGRAATPLTFTALDATNQAVVINEALLNWGIVPGQPADVVSFPASTPTPPVRPVNQSVLSVTGIKVGTTQVLATYTEFGTSFSTATPATITVSSGSGSVQIPVQ